MGDSVRVDDDPARSIFAVLDVGTTIDADDVRWPTAVIDASDDPSVADLARVHAVEGIGDITTTAVAVPTDPTADGTIGVEHVLMLSVTVAVPVRCSFAVIFSLPLHRPFLDDAATAGQLVIATTAPDHAAADRPLWLALDLDRETLERSLPD